MVLRILQLFLILAVIRAVWRLLRGVLEGAGYRRVDSPQTPGVKLVRDPMCGVFVSPNRALAARAALWCTSVLRNAGETGRPGRPGQRPGVGGRGSERFERS